MVVAAHQQITQEWWDKRRGAFHLVASELVIQEAGAGDEHAARARLQVLADVELVAVSADALALAAALLDPGPLPRRAGADALHIAISVTNGVDYLLTWNRKHMANAVMRSSIDDICRSKGLEPSIICTPEELLED